MCILQELKGGKQFYTTLGFLNLGAFCMGITIAWPTSKLFYFSLPRPTYDEMMTDDSLLQAVMNVGTSVGVVIPMCFADILGRKIIFQISGAVDAVSWIAVAIANTRTSIMIAAFVGGIATGIFFTTMTLYVAEISSPTNRGVVGASVMFCIYFGVLFIHCTLLFLNSKIFLSIMVFTSLTFMIGTSPWMIESPYFLYQRGKTLEAKISLKALRGMRTVMEIDEEFTSMARFFNTRQCSSSKGSLFHQLKPRSLTKSAAIILPILCVSQMVGGFGMQMYTEKVLNIAIPNYGKILLTCLSLLSVSGCVFLIEKIGRRPLLMISVIVSALCCFSLGIHRYVIENQCQKTGGPYIVLPIIAISLYYAVYSLGLIPILPIFTGEIFPHRVKTIAVGSCTMFVYLVQVAIGRTYQSLSVKGYTCVAFTAFMIVGSIGIPLIMLSLPRETKGKSLCQIQDDMGDLIVTVT